MSHITHTHTHTHIQNQFDYTDKDNIIQKYHNNTTDIVEGGDFGLVPKFLKHALKIDGLFYFGFLSSILFDWFELAVSKVSNQ